MLLLDEEPLVRPLRRTKPPPALVLLAVACWTQPVIVTGDPYVLVA